MYLFKFTEGLQYQFLKKAKKVLTMIRCGVIMISMKDFYSLFDKIITHNCEQFLGGLSTSIYKSNNEERSNAAQNTDKIGYIHKLPAQRLR